MAMTAEENERMTRVGPGTPMGDLLRRYWHPVAAALELADNPSSSCAFWVKTSRCSAPRGRIRADRRPCPHRCMSMEFGVPEHNGLRCGYHGWCLRRERAVRRAAVRRPRVIPTRTSKTASRSRPIRCKSSAACSSPTSARCRRRCCRAGICSCATISTVAVEKSIRCRATGCSAWTTRPIRSTSNFCTPRFGNY